ncbi:MAG TPA: hypothetical protein VK820_02500 [Steroidobacteraceae bacterium]|nr:hypothetical protein [Steroidobacteraceae bacterium]
MRTAANFKSKVLHLREPIATPGAKLMAQSQSQSQRGARKIGTHIIRKGRARLIIDLPIELSLELQ